MQKMINFDDVTKQNIKKHNPNWLESPNYPYRILTARSSGCKKTNSMLNLISRQSGTDKIYWNAKYRLNGWEFVYELSGCGFESRCCHLMLNILMKQNINF